MIERRDENTPENASGIAQQIAQTLELAFADEGASVTISGHHVYLEVPCPSRAVDDALRIHWWYDEVLLSFDNFHADFGPSGSFSDEDSRDKAIAAALDEAIATAREFLAERQVVITWYREGQVAVARREVPEGAMTAVHKDGKKLFGPCTGSAASSKFAGPGSGGPRPGPKALNISRGEGGHLSTDIPSRGSRGIADEHRSLDGVSDACQITVASDRS